MPQGPSVVPAPVWAWVMLLWTYREPCDVTARSFSHADFRCLDGALHKAAGDPVTKKRDHFLSHCEASCAPSISQPIIMLAVQSQAACISPSAHFRARQELHSPGYHHFRARQKLHSPGYYYFKIGFCGTPPWSRYVRQNNILGGRSVNLKKRFWVAVQ